MWALKIFDGDVAKYCYPDEITLGILACAMWTTGTGYYDGEIYINDDVSPYKDPCGNGVLMHEIQHLVTRDRENCHEI